MIYLRQWVSYFTPETRKRFYSFSNACNKITAPKLHFFERCSKHLRVTIYRLILFGGERTLQGAIPMEHASDVISLAPSYKLLIASVFPACKLQRTSPTLLQQSSSSITVCLAAHLLSKASGVYTLAKISSVCDWNFREILSDGLPMCRWRVLSSLHESVFESS